MTGNADTTIGTILQSWSQAWSSTSALVDPSNPNTSEGQHDTQGNLGIPVSAAVNSQYSAWFTKTKTASATATSTSTSAVTPTYKSTPVPPGTKFDYVVVGGGAGGVPIADKVSETGKTTLLIERGPPSSGRWGGSKHITPVTRHFLLILCTCSNEAFMAGRNESYSIRCSRSL